MTQHWSGSPHWWLLAGSINMLLAVVFGALGTHVLRAHLPPEWMAAYRTGNQYHVYHALGLFGVALAVRMVPTSRSIRWSGMLILAGLVLFSGSLYALGLTGRRWIGVMTPFGGAAFLAAWLLLAFGAWKGCKSADVS